MDLRSARAAITTFGRRVRAGRLAAGLTQAELGRRARVGRAYISEIELGISNPSLETMVLVADVLACPVADLLRDHRPTAAYLCEADMRRVHDSLRVAMAVLRRRKR